MVHRVYAGCSLWQIVAVMIMVVACLYMYIQETDYWTCSEMSRVIVIHEEEMHSDGLELDINAMPEDNVERLELTLAERKTVFRKDKITREMLDEYTNDLLKDILDQIHTEDEVQSTLDKDNLDNFVKEFVSTDRCRQYEAKLLIRSREMSLVSTIRVQTVADGNTITLRSFVTINSRYLTPGAYPVPGNKGEAVPSQRIEDPVKDIGPPQAQLESNPPEQLINKSVD